MNYVSGADDPLAAFISMKKVSTPTGEPINPDFYNIIGAQQEPYIYLPITEVATIKTAHLFYQDQLGNVTELNRVDSFSANYANEYIVVGNCFI